MPALLYLRFVAASNNLCAISGLVSQLYHLQSSPSAIITICNHHHLQSSPSAIITICNHHHLQSSPSAIITMYNYLDFSFQFSRAFDNTASVIFGIVMSLWGSFFIDFWLRQSYTVCSTCLNKPLILLNENNPTSCYGSETKHPILK